MEQENPKREKKSYHHKNEGLAYSGQMLAHRKHELDLMRKKEYEKCRTDIFKKVMQGKLPSDIQVYMREAYGLDYSDRQISNLVGSMRKRIHEYYESRKDKIAADNYTRLEQMISDSMERGDYRIALQCITELNKMGKVYEAANNINLNQIIELKVNGD